MDKFAVVILNYNTFDDTVVCVDSIRKFTAGTFYKLFIVDNFSPDKSGAKLLEKYKLDNSIDVILSTKNLGFSGGNNLGIKAALNEGFEYVYLLNSDIILLNDAFSYMQAALTSNNEVAIVGPTIYNSENMYAQFARKGVSLAMFMASRRAMVTIYPKLKDQLRFYKYSLEEDYIFDGMVYGCCFGIKASFIKETKSLDENIFMYYEEDILAYLLKNKGMKAMIASKAKTIHNEGVSTKKSSSDRMLFTRFYRWTSVLYVLKKYAKVNGLICSSIALMNIFNWAMLSIRSKKYREKLKEFIKENKRVLK